MSWYLNIGVDTSLLKKVDPKENERQTFVFTSLSIMLYVIAFVVFFSTAIYSLVLFHDWLITTIVSLFSSLVVFNLYRLFVLTAMDVSGSSLEEFYNNHELHYNEHIDTKADLINLSDDEISRITLIGKNKLREKSELKVSDKKLSYEDVITMTFRVIIISVIALVFATGIELFMFKHSINETLLKLKSEYIMNGDSWMVNNILAPDKNDQFYIINTNSLLLAIDILKRGIGNWKLVLDLIFLIVFLIPLAMVFKSKEIKNSEYVRELAISEITITFYHYLKTQRISQKIKKEYFSDKT